MLNKVQIIGRLGKDPETRYLPNGDAVCSFSVATSEKYKDKATGQIKEVVEWHNVSTFSKLAEICGQYLKKGSLVYVEGKITTRKYTDRDGIERYATSIKGEGMRMLDTKDSNSTQNQPHTQQAPSPQPSGSGFEDMDDNIPY